MSDLAIRGPQYGGLGVTVPRTADYSGATRTQDAHARFTDAVLNGKLFSWGKTATALSANSISLTATTTPIIGVWNPSDDTNLVILQAKLALVVAGNSAVAQGGLVWAASRGNTAITTGNAPWNRKTLVQSGSVAKGFDLATALTGITNNLVILEGSAFGGLVAAQGATATPLLSGGEVENFDGSLIVPPGGVLALLNTVSTTTISVTAGLLWEEVPII